MNNNNLLDVRGLKKLFANTVCLKGIDLSIKEGEIFGLLGPNGAGKTTLIKCIFKLLKTSQGEISYQGAPLDFNTIHNHFGYLPENFLPPQELNAEEFLNILGLGLGSPDVAVLLEQVGLDGRKKIKAYSKGMIQRLGLATALIKNPQFIILDEPTSGLDPVGQSRILSLLKKLNKQGKTVLFSSHDLFQVQSICDRVGIIHNGSIKFTGRIEELLSKNNCDSLGEAFLNEVKDND